MSDYCCLEHALCDVEVPGDVGARARWAYSELAQRVEAGEIDRWCGQTEGSSGALVMEDAER